MIAPQFALILACTYAIVAIMIVALAPTFPFIIRVLDSIFNPLVSIIDDVEAEELQELADALETLDYSFFEVIDEVVDEPASTIYGELKYRTAVGQNLNTNYSHFQCVSDKCRFVCSNGVASQAKLGTCK